AHRLGILDQETLQDARHVLPAAEPIAAVVGVVPAIAEDRPVDEGCRTTREQPVAVLDVRLHAQARVEGARRLERSPGHECSLEVDRVAREQLHGREAAVEAPAHDRGRDDVRALRRCAVHPLAVAEDGFVGGVRAQEVELEGEAVGEGDVVGVVKGDPLAVRRREPRVACGREPAMGSPHDRGAPGGATWRVLEPWARAGRLPHLAGLMARGSWGTLRSTVPALTLPAWSSLTTGRNPGAHGVFAFRRLAPDRYDSPGLASTSDLR